MSLLDSLRQSLTFDASGYPSRRPRSPSLNHNVKQPAEVTNFTSDFNDFTASQHQPRSSVGAGYRCEVSVCQTQKSPKKTIFFRGLWTLFGAPAPFPRLSGSSPTYSYRAPPLHIRRKRMRAWPARDAAARHFRPQNKGFSPSPSPQLRLAASPQKGGQDAA